MKDIGHLQSQIDRLLNFGARLHQSVFRMIRLERLSVERAATQLDLPPQRIEALLIEVIIALVVAAQA